MIDGSRYTQVNNGRLSYRDILHVTMVTEIIRFWATATELKTVFFPSSSDFSALLGIATSRPAVPHMELLGCLTQT